MDPVAGDQAVPADWMVRVGGAQTALVAVVLFATGFWSADVKEGSLPQVDVSAKGGELPKVDVDSKEVVVGTKKTEVEVPVVGVKDNGEK